jgi:hypothetical protein
VHPYPFVNSYAKQNIKANIKYIVQIPQIMDDLRGVFIHNLIPKDREKKSAKKEYHNGGI